MGKTFRQDDKYTFDNEDDRSDFEQKKKQKKAIREKRKQKKTDIDIFYEQGFGG